jgi:hypothetical protein
MGTRFANIARHERAFSVQVTRGKVTHTRWFADAVWGGKAQSLLAARMFLDRLLMRIDPDTRVRRTPPAGTRSRTGIVGVTLEHYEVEGRRYARLVASWREDGKARRKRFSLERYGRERALALAVEARRTGVARRHAAERLRQREDAAQRLRTAPLAPRQVKSPLSRRGIRMPARPRRASGGRKPRHGAGSGRRRRRKPRPG